MVLSSEPAGRRALAQSRTLPLTSITRTETATEPETRRRSSTLPLPYNISGDVPIFSRNIPSAFSVAASYSSDREEISFSNSILYLEEDQTKLPRTLSPANLETDLVLSPSQVHFKVPFHHPGQAAQHAAGGTSLLDGIWGCFKPMWSIMGKNKPINMERGETYHTTPHFIKPHQTTPHWTVNRDKARPGE